VSTALELAHRANAHRPLPTLGQLVPFETRAGTRLGRVVLTDEKGVKCLWLSPEHTAAALHLMRERLPRWQRALGWARGWWRGRG
jgi:hypothetical protein